MAVRLILVLVCLFISSPVFSQPEDISEGIYSKNGYTRFMSLGVGPVYQSFYDEAISGIRYEGVGFAPSVSFIKNSETKHSELELRSSSVTLGRPSDDMVRANARNLRATIDYRLMRPIEMRSERNYFAVGACFSTMFNYRQAPHLVNSGKIYEYAISLGATAKFTRETYFNDRSCYVSLGLGIPFVANVARSGYFNRNNSLGTEAKPVSDFFNGSQVGTFGKYLRLNPRINYEYPLLNGNRINVGYSWDYTKLKTINAAHLAEHTVVVAIMFNY